jgi:hypothetical protein
VDFATVDYDVVVVPPAVDLDLTERNQLGSHGRFSSLDSRLFIAIFFSERSETGLKAREIHAGSGRQSEAWNSPTGC